jgi:hypothetical protein
MNPKSPLDELFRRKLAHYEVPPSDDLWGNIQLARAKKPTPRLPFWAPWFITSVCLATLTYFSQDFLFQKPIESTAKQEKSFKSRLKPNDLGLTKIILLFVKAIQSGEKLTPLVFF